MTTIPFSYPRKWVIADLYLYLAVCSTNYKDLNNNFCFSHFGRIISFFIHNVD